MDQLRLFDRPSLRNPVLIAAFSGWNDAAQSATSAVHFLLRRWLAQRFAEIDADQYFDFTQTRPTVRIVDGELRKIEWPTTEFFYHIEEQQDRDFILLLGVEPQLRWQSFIGTVATLCEHFGARTVITLGALLADVSHSVPTKVLGFSNDPAFAARLRRLDAEPSHYEGPTGIVGVLNAVLTEQGLSTASIWGSVPMYLSAIPNPKVTLAILQRLTGLLDLHLYLGELEELSRQFDRQVADVVANNPQIAAYVKQLEEKLQAAPPDQPGETPTAQSETPELPNAQSLVQDVEEFLRRSRPQGEDEET